MLSPRHAAALAYAQLGIPVFPCLVGTKRPATPQGFENRSADPAQINAWWAEADYNLAIVPEDAGWCVVDIDVAKGGEVTWLALCGENGPAPATYTVMTPNGGRHLYFIGSLPSSASKLGPGVDTRGRGSYVLVPPSVVDGRFYRAA